MEDTFTKIYEQRSWGGDIHSDFVGNSGSGSAIRYNKDTYIPFLKRFIANNNIKSVVDLGCGDFRCGPIIYDDLDVTYTGYDTYDKLIESHKKTYTTTKYSFNHLNFYDKKEEIIGADLCILKDVIQHWPVEYIIPFLDYLIEKKLFKYILLCNCCYQTESKTDIVVGDFRPLSSSMFPLNKYKPISLFRYNTKEICVIVESS